MIINDNDGYILYRFQRAKETYDEAQLMVQHKHWNSALNRLYYACFYAVIALLLKHKIETKTHDGTRIQFSLHFIKTGKIDSKLGKLYNNLCIKREKGDYGDLFDFDEEDVLPLIDPVREFVAVIGDIIGDPLTPPNFS